MSAAHVYFADVPISNLSSSSLSPHDTMSKEGHRSTFESLNDDATLQRQCSAITTTRDRSISPGSNSPVPRYERNMGFFRQLSRRFGLRSNDDLVYSGSNEEDNQSSSTDSCSSHSAAVVAAAAAKENMTNNTSVAAAAMTEHISCASSETSSTVDIEEQQNTLQQQQTQLDDINDDTANKQDKQEANCYRKDRKSFARSSFSRLQRRSTTSIRRAFGAFTLSSRSLSCSGTTPPPHALLPTQSQTSSASSSTNNGTPIKSALKSSSNLELNKKYASSTSPRSAAAAAAASCSTTKTASSLSFSTSSTMAASATSNMKSSLKSKTKPPPQRILRQPVSYTYLKGISGLPTQRVPRSSVCCQYVRR